MQNDVAAVIESYFRALNRSDADGLAATFAEDGAFMGDEAATVSGRASIREFARAAFAELDVNQQPAADRSRRPARRCGGRPDQQHGHLDVRPHRHHPRSGPSRAVRPGRPGDGWRITHYMYNDTSPAGGSDE